jgi:SpoIID/LytB domain protein
MKRTLALVLGLLLALAPAAPGAAKRSSFVFWGSGYGHGIGMSQYGALGLARRGWSAEQIVRHYYQRVKVGARKPASDLIRVGLLQHAGSVRLIAAQGAYDLVLESGEVVDQVAAGSRRTIEITADRKYRIRGPGGEEVGTFGGAGNDLVAKPGGRIRIPEWGHDISRGELRFDISGDGRAHLLAVLGVEDYLHGISEVPNSWPKEALGAQAIAARTYAYWRLAGGLRPGCGCDVFATTADQNYTGWDKESVAGANRWGAAIAETERVVITYGGNPIFAVYSSSSGGFTEDIQSVWTGASPQPYLQGTCDPGDAVSDNPSRFWSVSFGRSSLTSELKPLTGDIGEVVKFGDYRRGVSGRVTSMRVVGTNGSAMVEGWDVRSALSLRDTRFSINRNLNITGSIRDTYDRIRCKPGRAVTPQKRVQGGSWQKFVKGRMYANERRSSVTWLRGALLREYLSTSGPRGRLHLPFRVRRIKGGMRGWFDGGIITCTGGCRVTFG